MGYLFTSESVSEGHPDKVADQISDALLDNFIAFDPDSKVACETLVTTGQVVLAGEVRSKTYVDVLCGPDTPISSKTPPESGLTYFNVHCHMSVFWLAEPSTVILLTEGVLLSRSS